MQVPLYKFQQHVIYVRRVAILDFLHKVFFQAAIMFCFDASVIVFWRHFVTVAVIFCVLVDLAAEFSGPCVEIHYRFS